MIDINTFSEWLNKYKKVVITTHQNPDADALGSSLGLSLFLKKKGLDSTVISPTEYPAFLNWMPDNDKVVIATNEPQEEVNKLFAEADMIFCLDFSSLNRINHLGDLVNDSSAKKVLIDHHLSPEDFPDFRRWSTDAAATAELVYELIVDLGDEELIDSDISNCLYAGIMTDTGNFKHPNVTEHVFQVCARLIARGANIAEVTRNIYDTNSFNRLKLLGYTLNNRLKYLPEYNTAYMALSKKELYRFNAQAGDTEGLVNYALSLNGVKFAALFTEKLDIVKMSFRSVGDFSVNEFARDNFSGGGHKNAAGGCSKESLDDTVKKFEKLLTEYKSQLIE